MRHSDEILVHFSTIPMRINLNLRTPRESTMEGFSPFAQRQSPFAEFSSTHDLHSSHPVPTMETPPPPLKRKNPDRKNKGKNRCGIGSHYE
jgi:hypothetical protein